MPNCTRRATWLLIGDLRSRCGAVFARSPNRRCSRHWISRDNFRRHPRRLFVSLLSHLPERWIAVIARHRIVKPRLDDELAALEDARHRFLVFNKSGEVQRPKVIVTAATIESRMFGDFIFGLLKLNNRKTLNAFKRTPSSEKSKGISAFQDYGDCVIPHKVFPQNSRDIQQRTRLDSNQRPSVSKTDALSS